VRGNYRPAVPTFRKDLTALSAYVPGRPIEEAAAEVGLSADEMVMLASNESPDGPFPGVIEAAAGALASSNRYPDNDTVALSRALSDWLEVPEDHLWVGAGSVALLCHIGLAVGGPGTSAVFAWPSFVMYRTVSAWAMSATVEVPLTAAHVHDLGAIGEAIRDDTTVVYLCNPNNPSGTIVSGDEVESFIATVPEGVLVVVDEAYHDFVTDPAYRSALSLAARSPNLVVLRTFSKVYGLAAHRVGYAVGHPGTLAELRKAQPPFTVGQVGQVAAAASIGDRAELSRRIAANAAGRHHLLGAIAERGLDHSDSQANFVYFRLGDDSGAAAAKLFEQGVIIRPMSKGWVRVTVGSEEENRRFVEALDQVLAASA
jgi:histidinol-phosphate aminotransferase